MRAVKFIVPVAAAVLLAGSPAFAEDAGSTPEENTMQEQRMLPPGQDEPPLAQEPRVTPTFAATFTPGASDSRAAVLTITGAEPGEQLELADTKESVSMTITADVNGEATVDVTNIAWGLDQVYLTPPGEVDSLIWETNFQPANFAALQAYHPELTSSSDVIDFRGTGTPGATIELSAWSVDDFEVEQNIRVLGSVVVGPDGTWTIAGISLAAAGALDGEFFALDQYIDGYWMDGLFDELTIPQAITAPAPSTTPKKGPALANTGSDDNTVYYGVGAGVLALAGAGVLFARRRMSHNS